MKPVAKQSNGANWGAVLPISERRTRISIVIDNYNYGHFLSEAIESCLAQTHQPLEIIVVDDGSTDNSRDVLAFYRNSPLIQIVLQRNQGQPAALQNGINRVTGDWVIGLDSDDYLASNCLEEVAKKISASVDWVYFRATVVDVNGNPIGVRPSRKLSLMQGEIWRQWILKGEVHTFPPQSFHCYSARFLRSVRLYPNDQVGQKTAVVPDRYLSLHASFDCKAAAIDSELGFYREHDSAYKLRSRKLAGIRAKLRQQQIIEEIAYEKLRAAGVPTRPRFYVDSAYGHWSERLISLVYDPAGHPHRNDTKLTLFSRVLSTYVTSTSIRPFGLLRAFFQYGAIALAPRELAWRIHRIPSSRTILSRFQNFLRRPASRLQHL
jgi:glycosyltransferase involved in cell wall biosynthesis